ncbi:MAG TPA: Mrp/NBP35 family ATP-binding protein [Candidatus Limnocylindria bacterium]|nr:Mrp/NBP35 family ATP-binding protein [Candidatus Limnocylindria bacterium]
MTQWPCHYLDTLVTQPEVPTPAEILDRLRLVRYPGFSRDIVSFGVVQDIEVASDGVTVVLAPSTAKEEVIREIEREVVAAVSGMPDLPGPVRLVRTAPPQAPQRRGPEPIPGVRAVLAVASGKGGVGKSTVATNLALALASLLPKVGLLDADVYGPSVPLMLGIGEKLRAGEGGRLVPLERYGLRVISMGMFLADDTPVIWRGPMLTKLLTEFLRNTEWGELDVLVLDLPPGTGDVQLTLTQQLPITGGIIVSTPQDVALADVRRGIKMFQQMNAPVLGVIENMSFHRCPSCGAVSEPFGHGGARRLAEETGVPLLGEVPLARGIREAGDRGAPIVVADPTHPQSRAFFEIAERVLVRLREAASAPARTSTAPSA